MSTSKALVVMFVAWLVFLYLTECRICYFKDLGHREWDCAVHSEKDAGFSQETKNNMKKLEEKL